MCTLVALVGAAKLPSASYGTPSRVSGGSPGVSGGSLGSSSDSGSADGFSGSSAGTGFGASTAVGGFGGSTGTGFGSSADGGFGSSAGAGFDGAGSGRSPSGSYSPSGPVVPILTDERQGPDQAGNYNFNFETGDGISRQEQGAPQGPTGAVAAQGGWSFTFPDGTPAVFKFVADEGGYRVESDLVPTPHPLPAHAIAQIEKARQEDAAAAAAGGRGSYDASGSASQFTGAPAGGFGGSSAGGFGGSPAGRFGSTSGDFGGSTGSGFGSSTGGFGTSTGGSTGGAFSETPGEGLAAGTSAVVPSRTYGAP
ncbi:pupal cuticle protein 20-like [Cherax quadricarinatus]|uniref:pupal cuticle protein 20-like n=1 Tax=Cherax quadricarinatus TaxID=27406 RepID=UPI00387E4F94